MLLKNKVAVIYGAGGAIGGAVARAVARGGARLFLTGNRLEPVAALARDITANGGVAEVAEVDALDEKAVDMRSERIEPGSAGAAWGAGSRRRRQRRRGQRRVCKPLSGQLTRTPLY